MLRRRQGLERRDSINFPGPTFYLLLRFCWSDSKSLEQFFQTQVERLSDRYSVSMRAATAPFSIWERCALPIPAMSASWVWDRPRLCRSWLSRRPRRTGNEIAISPSLRVLLDQLFGKANNESGLWENCVWQNAMKFL